MKKLITIFTVLIFLAMPVSVFADGEVLGDTTEEVCVETTVYGGGVGVVCGVKHEPVDTGIEDMVGILASGILVSSGIFYSFSKNKAKKLI